MVLERYDDAQPPELLAGMELRTPLHNHKQMPLSPLSNSTAPTRPGGGGGGAGGSTKYPSSVASRQSRRSTTQRLLENDNAFVNIASALLDRRKSKNMRAMDALEATLLPRERLAFVEALRRRTSDVPFFPESGEPPINRILREVNRLFGTALCELEAKWTNVEEEEAEATSAYQTETPSKQQPRMVDRVNHAAQNAYNHRRLQEHEQAVPPPPYRNPFTDHREPPLSTNSDYRRFPGDMQQPQQPRIRPHPYIAQQQQQQQLSPPPPTQLTTPYEPRREEERTQHQAYSGRSHPSIIAPHNSRETFVMDAVQPIDSSSAYSSYRRVVDTEAVPAPLRSPPTRTNEGYRPPEIIIPPQAVDIDWNLPVARDRVAPDEKQTSNPLIEQIAHGTLPKRGSAPEPTRTTDSGEAEPDMTMVEQDLAPHERQNKRVLLEKEARPNSGQPRPEELRQPARQHNHNPSKSSVNHARPERMGSPVSVRTAPPTLSTSQPVASTSLAPTKKGNGGDATHNLSTREAGLVTEEPKKETFKEDIACNRALLLCKEVELMNKQAETIKKLTIEVDRVKNLLATTLSPAEQGGYESYLAELHAQLEKWSKSSTSHHSTSAAQDTQDDPKLTPSLKSRRGPVEATHQATHQATHEQKGTEDTSIVPAKKSSRRKRTPESRSPRHRVDSPRYKADPSPMADARRQWRVAKIVAPDNLPEGFTFEARVGDEVFLATVPNGGVSRGEVFSTRMGDIYGKEGVAAERTRVYKDMDAPPSRWRDELFDCFRHGVDHPFLWNSLLCPFGKFLWQTRCQSAQPDNLLVALAQIMGRVQLTSTGDRLVTLKSRTHMSSYVFVMILLALANFCYFGYFLIAEPESDAILIATLPIAGLDLGVLIYFLYMVTTTRRLVRREFDIPELRCHGYEDCCISTFCTPCAIAQMGRHTADYETYAAYCCTDTGLANHIEVKLPYEYMEERDVMMGEQV